MRTWSDEQVMTYADGELGADEARALELALAADALLAQRVERFRADRRALRKAFDARRQEPVPARLLALFERAERRRARSAWALPLAMAATLVLGVGATLWVLRGGQATVLPSPALLSAALEGTPSGLPYAPREGSAQEEIVPLRTLRLGDGSWCREFSFARIAAGDVETLRALACRAGDGNWPLRALLRGRPGRLGDKYTLASGDATLPELGPVETIAPAREQQLIRDRWE